MVCEKCEKKLDKVITPDPWKAGARNTTDNGGRKVNENKALTGAKNRFSPMSSTFRPCRYVPKKSYSIITIFLNIKSQFFVEYAAKRFIRLARIIANRVLTKKVFVQCVGRS